jgi:hypothetical protein
MAVSHKCRPLNGKISLAILGIAHLMGYNPA